MLYDISDVCRLFGLTATSIRHYEEMGLIHPARNAANQRKYSEMDLRLLLRIKLFRQLGLSLTQIDDQFFESTTDSRAEVCVTLDQRLSEVEKEMRRLDRTRRIIASYRHCLSIASETPVFQEADMPACYVLSLPNFFGRTPAEQAGVAEWLKWVPSAFVTERYDVEGDAIRQTNGLAVPQSVAEQEQLPLLEQADLIPGGRALYTVFWTPHEGKLGITKERLLPFVEQARRALRCDRLTLISHFLFKNTEQDRTNKCVDFWILPAQE